MTNYRDYITIEPGKRSGKACVRGMRITVADVLGYLAAGMTHTEIIGDFPELTHDDLLACLAYAADAENRTIYGTSQQNTIISLSLRTTTTSTKAACLLPA